MKMRIVFSFCFISNFLFGQNGPYFFSSRIDSILIADSTNFKFQTASWNYSFIGDYKKSLEIKDKQFPNAKPSIPTEAQSAYFSKYKPVTAQSEILKQAAKSRVVILNEAHHIALHRVYLMNLLEDLQKVGYTFLGLEALNYNDTALNKRGYPILESGFYTQEPCFGNMLREAMDKQITLFPYEKIYADSLQASMSREKAQALNIKKMMDSNPTAKFIIYCGYDHAVEDTLKNFMGLPMAGQLKQLTGEDPFTIDQTVLTEYFMVGNAYRKLMPLKGDFLFIDSTSNYFNRASFPKKIDCNLYHPQTSYYQNRPTWLKNKNTQFVNLQNKINIGYPYIIKIYLTTDDVNLAVPIDVVEVKSADEKTASLVYKRKKQIAIVLNDKGEKQLLKL